MNKALPGWLGGALLLGLLGWGLYQGIEFYDDTEASGWSRAASLNPYLAAQQFLERSGIEVTEVNNLSQLGRLGGVGTLFFSDGNQVQSPRQLRQVMEWLEHGGNVIYSANRVDHEADRLLAEFDVEVEWSETDGEGEDRSLADTMREYNRQIEQGKSREQASEVFNQRGQSPTDIRFGDEVGMLQAVFDNDRTLSHPAFGAEENVAAHQPFSWSSSDSGVHLMQFEVGSGLLTIVSDPSIWTSARLDRRDHAYLLWLLISIDGSFATLRSVVRASWWQLLKNQAGALLFAGALLILLAIWRAGHRFGRIVEDHPSETRALGQHFSALSQYLWQQRDFSWLLESLRQRVWHRAGLALGGFTVAERPRQIELLAERSAVNADAIAQAFDSSEFNESSFVTTVRLLKRIEQSL